MLTESLDAVVGQPAPGRHHQEIVRNGFRRRPSSVRRGESDSAGVGIDGRGLGVDELAAVVIMEANGVHLHGHRRVTVGEDLHRNVRDKCQIGISIDDRDPQAAAGESMNEPGGGETSETAPQHHDVRLGRRCHAAPSRGSSSASKLDSRLKGRGRSTTAMSGAFSATLSGSCGGTWTLFIGSGPFIIAASNPRSPHQVSTREECHWFAA